MTTILEILCAACLLASGVFTLLAGVGVARLPTLGGRIHAAAKAGGAALLLAVAAVFLADPSWVAAGKGALIVLFSLLTLPITAQLILGKSLGTEEAEASNFGEGGD